MAEYSIRIRNKSGDYIGEVINWKDLKFNERLNDYGTCTFTIPVSDQQTKDLIGLRTLETVIFRDGSIVWAGEQSSRRVTLEANSSNRIEIQSFTFFEMLNSMYSSRFVRYNGVDQGQIMKGLVDTWQATTGGDLGLTFNTIPATTNRDRSYYSYNVMQAWQNMSNVADGPDFYFHPDKSIDILPKVGIDKSTQVFFDWDINIAQIDINDDFTNPVNRAIMMGEGYGEEQVVITITNPTTRDIYGLRGKTFSEIDVSNSNLLIDKGTSQLNKLGTPVRTIKFSQLSNTNPQFGEVKVGDTVRIRLDEGIYNINDRYRIYEYNVKIDDNGVEAIQYFGGLI